MVAGGPGAEHLDGAFDQGRVVAAVVDDAVAILPGDPAEVVWELVRLDEVAAANLDAVEAVGVALVYMSRNRTR